MDSALRDPTGGVSASQLGLAEQTPVSNGLEEKHLVFQENQKGVSFGELIGPYLQGAKTIRIVDPYIRQFYQVRNLMELLEVIASQKAEDEEVSVELLTSQDEYDAPRQDEYLGQIADGMAQVGVAFTWEYDETGTIHARHITANHGWKILLDRGLDIYQRFDSNDAFSIAARLPKERAVKAFEVTFLKDDREPTL